MSITYISQTCAPQYRLKQSILDELPKVRTIGSIGEVFLDNFSKMVDDKNCGLHLLIRNSSSICRLRITSGKVEEKKGKVIHPKESSTVPDPRDHITC